jgi:hypothetical protein
VAAPILGTLVAIWNFQPYGWMGSDAGRDIPSDVVPHAVDPESTQRLWELSELLFKA